MQQLETEIQQASERAQQAEERAQRAEERLTVQEKVMVAKQEIGWNAWGEDIYFVCGSLFQALHIHVAV